MSSGGRLSSRTASMSRTAQRNIERHVAGVPELSIVSALRVSVGCDSEGEDCAHTLDSTDESFDQYYYSHHENKTAGANTKAVLVPANSSEGGNAAVVGTFDLGTSETHTYRISMTAGKTYTFDDTYRRWALMSGEWHGKKHFYLPDEFRLSLYTKNSAGQLEPVADFQNEHFQLTHGEPGHLTFPFTLTEDYPSNDEYFSLVRQLVVLFENADLFPPVSQYRTICEIDTAQGNYFWSRCDNRLDISIDDGRQLRKPGYTPTQSGVYYLQVTRVKDDAPVWGPDVKSEKPIVTDDCAFCLIDLKEAWYITVAGYETTHVPAVEDENGNKIIRPNSVDDEDIDTHMLMCNGYQSYQRKAFPYYEISVEVSD